MHFPVLNFVMTFDGFFLIQGDQACGRKYHHSTRIVGGTIASPGEFPWQAGLFWRSGVAKGKYFCSGALIDKWWVLTAGHCFVNSRDPSLYKIVLGESALLQFHPKNMQSITTTK